MGNPSDLIVSGLYAGYGSVGVVRGVSFSAKSGEVTTIIGPNGAGKSTLLKALFGLARVTSGSAKLGNVDILKLSYADLIRAGVAFVPQGRCNFPDMTVEENLEMGGFVLPRRELKLGVSRMYDAFPLLWDRRRENAGVLSGGQQQVLEMAMALVTTPSALLIDEPSLGLAPMTLRDILDEVVRVSKRGVSVLMVEQNATQALERSQKGVVLETGEKAMEGAGAELLQDSRLGALYLGGAGEEV